MQTVLRKQEIQIFNLKWLLFPYLGLIFFKINRLEAIDEMNKLCKFHKNPIIHVDFNGSRKRQEKD